MRLEFILDFDEDLSTLNPEQLKELVAQIGYLLEMFDEGLAKNTDLQLDNIEAIEHHGADGPELHSLRHLIYSNMSLVGMKHELNHLFWRINRLILR